MKPKLHYFNPTSDIAIAKNTRDYVPRGHLLRFEKELECLHLLLAGEGDLVILHEKPNESFLENVRDLGFKLPEIALIDEVLKPENTSHFNGYEFSPWGWSPHIDEKFSPILDLSNQFRWNDELRDLASRKTALGVLKACLALDQRFFIPNDEIPQVMDSVAAIEKFLYERGSMVMKAPWSSSGRGIQILRHGKMHLNHRQWIESVLNEQGYVMAEPYWNKILDFSFQFCSDEKGLRYLGHTFFETNKNGQFQKGFISDKLPEFSDDSGSHLFEEKQTETAEALIKTLCQSKINEKYRGYFGVDAMVVETPNGVKIHPCVEINLRKTMGLVSLSLRRKTLPSGSFWKIIRSNTKSDENSTNPDHDKFNIVPLTPVSGETLFMAELYVNNSGI